MRGRQVCWSNPKLQKLAKRFIPATDEVWRLHNRQDVDCLFFQGFSEEGHYGGRSRPSGTRQGIYCCTPSGRFLASINTTDPGRMAGMLRDALDAWKKLSKKERLLDYDPAERTAQINRAANQFPKDGLVVRVYSRDMPRKDLPDDWRATAWNVDSLWYRKDEARQVLPDDIKPDATKKWPEALVQRLVRHNLVDNVRGQTNGYSEAQVQRAELETTVRAIKKNAVTLSLRGASRATTTGSWPKGGAYAGMEKHGPHSRGVQTTMYGEATFDLDTGRFTSFSLVAAGSRWGQTRYNFRQGDLDETAIAFAIVLDRDDPGTQVAPAEVRAYGW